MIFRALILGSRPHEEDDCRVGRLTLKYCGNVALQLPIWLKLAAIMNRSGGPHKKHYSILRSTLGPPCLKETAAWESLKTVLVLKPRGGPAFENFLGGPVRCD